MYDPFARSFARSREHGWPDVAELLFRLEKLNLALGNVLDVGCGSGRLLEYLKLEKSLVSYRGLDLSVELVRIAREQYPDYEFSVGDMRDLRQDGQTFDTLVYLASFHHLCNREDQKLALSAAKKLLKPGGTIAMLNWNLLSTQNLERYPKMEGNEKLRNIPFSGHERWYYAFEPEELESLMQGEGFEVRCSNVTKTLHNIITIGTL